METQIDGDDEWFDVKDNDSYVASSESKTDKEFKDANESNFPEENNVPLIPEKLQPENSVKALIATDQKIGIQNNNQQPSLQSEKRSKAPIVAASALAIAGVALGIAIAVYLEVLAVGIAVGVCCLVASAIICCCNKPSNSLENGNVKGFFEDPQQPTL